MPDNIVHKASSSVVWSTVNNFAKLAISFISDIVLARLLMPEDYGAVGMLVIFMQISNVFMDGGFGSALIQKKRPTEYDYSTVFYWNFAMSLLLYIILYVTAPFISQFYKMPILKNVLRVQAIVLIISAFTVVNYCQLKKNFKFKDIAIVQITGSLIALVITVLLAYKGFGVWALVAHYIIAALIPAVGYWISSGWRPKIVFSWQSFKVLFSFGFFMFLARLVNDLSTNMRGLLIGRFYNAKTMGLFSKAMTLEGVASTAISTSLGQVSFPLYSEYQDDKDGLIRIIKFLTTGIAFVVFPLMCWLILVSKPLIILLYSDRWIDCIPYFQVLCLAGLATCLQAVNLQTIAAVGKSKATFRWTLIKRGVGLLLLFAGLYFYGLKGLLAATVIAEWFSYIVNASLTSKYIGYHFYRQLKDLFPILMLSLFSFVISSLVLKYLLHFNIYINAAIVSIVFVSVYLGGACLFKFESFSNIKIMLPVLLKKIHKK